MKSIQRHYAAVTVFGVALALAFAPAVRPVHAESADSLAGSLSPGFNPDTGQINPGVPIQVPSDSREVIRIPTPQEARAALMMPVSTQPSTGEAAVPATPAATTGVSPANEALNQAGLALAAPAGAAPPPSGPIGAIGQTLPAKVSQRNEVLDRVPIMAWPLGLNDRQRRQIYDAVMADKSTPAAGADALIPTSALTTEQALGGTHALPASVQNIAQLKGLVYVKGASKVLLVTPATRTVVDEIEG
jgi:hypothetical protein